MHAISAHTPDVLFLDIQMPGMDGLDVAQQASGKCHVVFVTAYDKYAVAAFEQGAVDYVMKPFSTARLATTVARLKAKVAGAPANLDGILKALAARLENDKEYLRWITASQGQNLRLITVDEICYFQADNKYTLVVTADTQTLIRRPIKELVDEVDPNVFWQIHRSTLVNVNAIAGVNRDFKGHLHVRLKQRKETLPVSESYVHLFKQM
jgi:DNA-binding LytR/AlgR family response regulator